MSRLLFRSLLLGLCCVALACGAELSIEDVLSDDVGAPSSPAAAPAAPAPAPEEAAPAPAPAPLPPVSADPPLVRKIIVRGGFVPEADVKAKMGTREGLRLDKKVLEEDFQRLYRWGRFADVQFRTEAVPGDASQVDIIVLLREKNVIKRISFRGNKKFKADKLLKMIKSTTGERYDEGQAARDARNIEQEYNAHSPWNCSPTAAGILSISFCGDVSTFSIR